MTVYRRELYDYAECINVGVLVGGRFPALDEILSRVIESARGMAKDRRLVPEPSALLVGTMFRCIAGHSHNCFAVSAFLLYRSAREKLYRIRHLSPSVAN